MGLLTAATIALKPRRPLNTDPIMPIDIGIAESDAAFDLFEWNVPR